MPGPQAFLCLILYICLSCPCLACFLPPFTHRLPLASSVSILSVCFPFACFSFSICPSFFFAHFPSSVLSLHPSLYSYIDLFSSSTFLSSIPLPSCQHYPQPSSASSPQHPPLFSTFLLTPWSASLLALDRLGVMRPRREPTGLGSWLWSAAPGGVISLRAITSPTSLGLLRGKGGCGIAVSLRPHTPSWSPDFVHPPQSTQ